MLKICFKIWLVANLLVFAVFAVALFPKGFAIGLVALLYSALFSLPVLLLFYVLLRLLQHISGTILFSWTVLLAGTALTASVPYFLVSVWTGGLLGAMPFVLPLSLICGYAAVLSFSPALHYLFQKFYYGKEPENG